MQPSIDARLRKSPLSIPLSPPVLGVLGVVLLLVGVFAVWQLRPFVLWAYNLRQAHDYQSVALAYPESRQSDALPLELDAEANQAALGHLAAAINWRPDDPYAYRLAGESYLAAGDLLNAVNVMETGIDKAGSDILLGWQLALAYEQVAIEATVQPGLSLVSRFATAVPDAPAVVVETPYCQPDDPRSCYRGEVEFSHPYAAFPLAGKVTADTLFLHPPARVTVPVDVPAGQPTLTFLMGLDPQALTWGTDGATFQVWVIEADGGILPVYERTVIGGELIQGWVPDQVDLTPWAGQSIELAVGTTAGPLNDNTGDWVGFGNVYISDAKTAAYRALMPEGRFRDAILNAPIVDTQLVGRGDEALYASRFDEAFTWYRRAEWSGADITSTTAYAQFLEIKARTDFETAFPYLQQAVTLDRGWGSSLNRFYAYFNYGRWLTEEGVYWASEGYLLVALEIIPDPSPILYKSVSEVHRFLAIGYTEQGRVDEALEQALKAVTLDPNSFLTQYQYGLALFRKDPTRLPEIEQAFARALDVDQSANSWQTIILVWLNFGDNDRTLAYCQTALQSYTPEQLGYTCWQGSGGASSILYREYQESLAAGDEERAYAILEETIITNGGWSNATQRFDAWSAWIAYLLEQERYEEFIPAAQTTLTLIHEYVAPYTILNLNQQIAYAFIHLERYNEALPYLQTALTITESAFLYFDYGTTLYYANPSDIATVRTAFEKAVTLATEDMRALQIDFWYQVDRADEASRLCLFTPLTTLEETLCVPEGETISSGMAFQTYLDTVATNEDSALFELERAVISDKGWQRLGYRYTAWNEWGKYLSDSGNIPDSIIAFDNALNSKDPRVSDGGLSGTSALLGFAYLQNDQPTQAIIAFERAIELDPENAFAYVNLARTYYTVDSSDLDRVRNLIDQALEIAPQDITIWRTVIGFWAFVDQPEEVERLCQVVPVEIKRMLGDLCLTGAQVPSRNSFFEFSRLLPTDPVAAYEALGIAVSTDLGWTDDEQRFTGWYYWGLHLLTQQDYEEAVAAFEMAVSVFPDTLPVRDKSEAYRQWGIALSVAGQLPEGLMKAQESITIDPTNAFAYVLYGQLTYRTNSANRREASDSFLEAVQLDPENTNLWSIVITFWLEENEPLLALELCNSASSTVRPTLDLYCWQEGEIPSTTYYREFIAQKEAGDLDAAYIALEFAVTVNGGWMNSTTRYLAWREWAQQLWRLKRFDEALIAFQTTIDAAPATIDSKLLAIDYEIMAFTLISLQRIEAAVDALAQAVVLDPNHAGIRLQYGYTLYAVDPANKAQAVEEFATALSLAPDQLSIWQDILGFWQRNGELAEMEALCQQAATTEFATDLASFCTVQ